MKVIFATTVILHLSCCFDVAPVTEYAVQYVRTGDTVDLSCDKKHRDKTMWYGQKINRSPFIILSAEMTSGHKERPSVKYHWGYNSRINVTWNPTKKSISLTIKNMNESDEGFYFCTIGEGILTTPGTGHILKLQGSINTSTATPVNTAGHMNVSRESGECGLVWSLLAILCFTSIFLTALVFLIIQKKRRRNTETSQTKQRTRQDENPEEDEGVQYSALRFSKPK